MSVELCPTIDLSMASVALWNTVQSCLRTPGFTDVCSFLPLDRRTAMSLPWSPASLASIIVQLFHALCSQFLRFTRLFTRSKHTQPELPISHVPHQPCGVLPGLTHSVMQTTLSSPGEYRALLLCWCSSPCSSSQLRRGLRYH